MSKPKNSPTNRQGLLTEQNVLVVLVIVLVALVGVLLIQNTRKTEIIDPVSIEQPITQ